MGSCGSPQDAPVFGANERLPLVPRKRGRPWQPLRRVFFAVGPSDGRWSVAKDVLAVMAADELGTGLLRAALGSGRGPAAARAPGPRSEHDSGA